MSAINSLIFQDDIFGKAFENIKYNAKLIRDYLPTDIVFLRRSCANKNMETLEIH